MHMAIFAPTTPQTLVVTMFQQTLADHFTTFNLEALF
jgi:hypothetical protein